MRQISIMETKTEKEEPLYPCQLKKLWDYGLIQCSFDCAFDHNCPVYYGDSSGNPIIGHRDIVQDAI